MIILVNVAHAQKYSIGLRAGGTLNWASFRDKDQKDTFSVRPSTGFTIGALIGFPLKNNYSVIIEGGFSQKSRTIKEDIGDLIKNHGTYKFVDGSLLLRKAYKFELGKDIPAEWFFNIGPEISYWLSGKGYFNDPEEWPYQIEFDKVPGSNGVGKYLYYNSANRLFFGLVLGVGFKAPLRNKTFITTELRFVSGHTNLGSNQYEYPTREWWGFLNYNDTLRMNLKLVSLSVAYTFDFDKVESRKGKSTLKKKLKKGR